MCVAHAIGLPAVAVVGTLTSSDPAIGEGILSLVVGAIASLFLFVPVLILALGMAQIIYENLVAFLLLGPIVISATLISVGGIQFGGFLAISPFVSSAVFYRLARLDNPMADNPEM